MTIDRWVLMLKTFQHPPGITSLFTLNFFSIYINDRQSPISLTTSEPHTRSNHNIKDYKNRRHKPSPQVTKDMTYVSVPFSEGNTNTSDMRDCSLEGNRTGLGDKNKRDRRTIWKSNTALVCITRGHQTEPRKEPCQTQRKGQRRQRPRIAHRDRWRRVTSGNEAAPAQY